MVSNDKSITSFNYDYLMGLNLDDIPILWENNGLSKGVWPKNSNEVVVGSTAVNDVESITIRSDNATLAHSCYGLNQNSQRQK